MYSRNQAKARYQSDFKALIYEKDLNRIAAWVEEYPDLETGGDLFGFWTHSGCPVVQFVLGPGPNSRHNPTSFYQDKEFLVETGEILREQHGLQHIGEWHSHHQLDLARPSLGDETTVLNALQRYDFPLFLLSIANLSLDLQRRNKWNVDLGCFLFTNSQTRYQTGAWVILPGENPIRISLYQYQWRRSYRFLKDMGSSSNWKGVIAQTTLQSQEYLTTEPIKISAEIWYGTEEGKELLKEIYQSFSGCFDEIQMGRNSSTELIYMSFSDDRGKWKIDFPNNFPQDAPLIQCNGKIINMTQDSSWKTAEALTNLIKYKLDIYYRGGRC